MTATVEAAVETSAPAVEIDEFGQIALDRLRGNIEALNSKVSVLKAAQGDEQATLEALRDNPPTPDAEALSKTISDLLSKVYDLEEKRDAILRPLVAEQMEKAKAGSDGVQAEVEELRKKVRVGSSYIKDLYGEAALAGLPTVSGLRAPSAGGAGGGTGQRRVRGYDVWVDGTLATSRNAQGKEVSNLAAAAKQIDVSTEDLRNAFFSAAGSDDSKKWPATVEFVVTKDGKNFSLVAKRVAGDSPRATEDGTASEAATEA